LRDLPGLLPGLKQKHIVPFGIVNHGPGGLDLHEAIAAQRGDRCADIVHLEKEHGFILRRVGLRAFTFAADESVCGVELHVMPRLFVAYLQAQDPGVKALGALKVVEIEFHANEFR